MSAAIIRPAFGQLVARDGSRCPSLRQDASKVARHSTGCALGQVAPRPQAATFSAAACTRNWLIDTPAMVKVRYRKPADRRSRPQRWRDALAELIELQADYQQWLDGLRESLADTATADALRAVGDLDLSEPEIAPPRGFGRD